MSESMIKHAFSTAGIMIGFTVIGTVLLAATYFSTRLPIADSERASKLRLILHRLSS